MTTRNTRTLLRPLPAVMILAASLLTGCSTDPDPQVEPPWVREAPVSPPGETLIVGYGIGLSEGDAHAAAGTDIRNQLARILLNRYDPEARGIADHTAREIERIAGARWDAMEPVDTYRSLRSDRWTELYLLVRYGEQEILADRSRIAERAADPARDMPERDLAPEAPSPAGPLRMLRELITATPPHGASARDQVLREAREIARRVSLRAQPGEIETSLGSALDRVITVRVLDDTGEVLSDDATLRVTVTENGPEGTIVRTGTTLSLGPRGSAEYRIPTPEFSGLMRVRFQPVWLEQALRTWRDDQARDDQVRGDQATDAEAAILDGLEADLTATVRIAVSSRASVIPTAVILIDRDIAGNPIITRDAARGAIQQLLDEGFRIVPVSITPAVESALTGRTDLQVSDLYDILPFEVLASVERVVVGSAGIVQFNETDGITVVIELQATAFDLRRDQRLTDIRFEERVTGRDARATLRSAFQSAGRRAARQLAPRLP